MAMPEEEGVWRRGSLMTGWPETKEWAWFADCRQLLEWSDSSSRQAGSIDLSTGHCCKRV